MRQRLVFLGLGTLLIAACGKQLSKNETAVDPNLSNQNNSITEKTSGCGSMGVTACDLFNKINAERGRRGLSPLIISERAILAAEEQARDMNVRNYVSSNRSQTADRPSESLSARISRFGFNGTTLEVVGKASTTTQTLSQWLSSTSASSKLLRSDLVSMGVGSSDTYHSVFLSTQSNSATGFAKIYLSKNSLMSAESLRFQYGADSLYAELHNAEAGAIACAEAYIPARNQNGSHCTNGSSWTTYEGGDLSTNPDWAPFISSSNRFVYGGQNPSVRILSGHPYIPNEDAIYKLYFKNRSSDPATIITFRVSKTPTPTTTTTTTLPGGAWPITGDSISVDTNNRSAVQNAYLNFYKPNLNTSINFTGNISSCIAGDPGYEFRKATVNVLNFYRAMVGLPANVKVDLNMSSRAQEAALMMDANNSLSHHPPTTWNCYTQAGAAGAGSSNLALGAAGPRAIALYINDPGSNNYAVGHRRWIFYAPLTSVGVGSTPGADALTVFGGWGGPSNPPGAFVAWPSRGYFPASLLPSSRRWSFSKSGIGLSQGRVRMTKNGQPISVQLEPYYGGYGTETLVWVPQGVDSSESTYRVIIDNLSSGDAITYDVKVMSGI